MPRTIGSLFAAGPPVVTPATHETVTKAQLGGPLVHGTNGTVDNIAADEVEALQMIRAFLSYLPNNRWAMPPITEPVAAQSDPKDPYAILRVIPEQNTKPYDPTAYLHHLVDAGSLFEIGTHWAPEIRTFFARFAGMPVAILAGDPRYNAGAIGAKGCDKICRLVGIASTFHLPVVNFVDCPGFSVGTLGWCSLWDLRDRSLVGSNPRSLCVRFARIAEKSATIRAGAKLTVTTFESRVPWFTCVVRKAFGVAAGILVARGDGDDAQTNVRVAWPSGEWGSLPLAGGVEAAFKGQLEAITDLREREKERVRLGNQLQSISSPVRSAEAFDIEEIISPLDTREQIVEWLKVVYGGLREQRMGERTLT